MKRIPMALLFLLLFCIDGHAFVLEPVTSFDFYWKMETYSNNNSVVYSFQGSKSTIQATGSQGNVVQQSFGNTIGIVATVNIKKIDNSGAAYVSNWIVGRKDGDRIGATVFVGPTEVRFRVRNFDSGTDIINRYYPIVAAGQISIGLCRLDKIIYYYIEGYGILEYTLSDDIIETSEISSGFGVLANGSDIISAEFTQVIMVYP